MLCSVTLMIAGTMNKLLLKTTTWLKDSCLYSALLFRNHPEHETLKENDKLSLCDDHLNSQNRLLESYSLSPISEQLTQCGIRSSTWAKVQLRDMFSVKYHQPLSSSSAEIFDQAELHHNTNIVHDFSPIVFNYYVPFSAIKTCKNTPPAKPPSPQSAPIFTSCFSLLKSRK